MGHLKRVRKKINSTDALPNIPVRVKVQYSPDGKIWSDVPILEKSVSIRHLLEQCIGQVQRGGYIQLTMASQETVERIQEAEGDKNVAE